MIYIDPPYGIKFGSNWQVSARKRDVKDGKLEDASREVEQIKAFRDTWELGIHSYLTYLRDRLIVAKDLLTESGSVFVQIGDENVHLVRVADGRGLRQRELRQPDRVQEDEPELERHDVAGAIVDYLLWYARDRERLQVSAALSAQGARRAGGVRLSTWSSCRTDRDGALTPERAERAATCRQARVVRR